MALQTKDPEDILSTAVGEGAQLNFLNRDVRVLGEEYPDKDFTGKDICPKKRY